MSKPDNTLYTRHCSCDGRSVCVGIRDISRFSGARPSHRWRALRHDSFRYFPQPGECRPVPAGVQRENHFDRCNRRCFPAQEIQVCMAPSWPGPWLWSIWSWECVSGHCVFRHMAGIQSCQMPTPPLRIA